MSSLSVLQGLGLWALSCWLNFVISCQRQSQHWRPKRLFADGLPPVDLISCPVKALLAGQNAEIIHFVRPERNSPDEQRWGIIEGETLTKGFQSHVELGPVKSMLGCKTKGKGIGFSWERAFQVLRIGFNVKAFRKSAPTSARVGRNKDSPPLVPRQRPQGTT